MNLLVVYIILLNLSSVPTFWRMQSASLTSPQTCWHACIFGITIIISAFVPTYRRHARPWHLIRPMGLPIMTHDSFDHHTTHICSTETAASLPKRQRFLTTSYTRRRKSKLCARLSIFYQSESTRILHSSLTDKCLLLWVTVTTEHEHLGIGPFLVSFSFLHHCFFSSSLFSLNSHSIQFLLLELYSSVYFW